MIITNKEDVERLMQPFTEELPVRLNGKPVVAKYGLDSRGCGQITLHEIHTFGGNVAKGNDNCKLCGFNLRDEIHKRVAAMPNGDGFGVPFNPPNM